MSAKRVLERAEERMRRAEMQAALARLAGNVAHDFNNMFTAMLGYLTLIERRSADARAELHELEQVVLSACRLSNQLMMVYGRPEAVQRQSDLFALIERVAARLGDLVPAGVSVQVQGTSGSHVRVDEAQIEQAVTALATNALEALVGAGTLTLAVEECGAEHLPLGGREALAYLVVRVTDTGQGIAPGELERAFEPFFTSKQPRVGRGFGLPLAYAAARRAGGELMIESRSGEGTTCRLVLPRAVRGA